MVDIPDEVFDAYNEFADDFIQSNFGVTCRLIYPARRIICVNCVFDPVGGKSSNKYKHGGPAPFHFGRCPTCGGDGYKEQTNFKDIKLRIYHDPKNWIKVADAVAVPDGSVQIIGMLSDLPEFNKADQIVVNQEQSQYHHWRFSHATEAFAHGFKRNRYFTAFLTRVG